MADAARRERRRHLLEVVGDSRFPGHGRVLGDGTILLTDLPTDVVQHIVVRMQLAHHIGRAAPTCRVVSVAARNVIKARQFSGKVVRMCLQGCDEEEVRCLAPAPDGRIVTDRPTFQSNRSRQRCRCPRCT